MRDNVAMVQNTAIILTIAKTTLLDLVRQKVFSILIVFAFVAIGSSLFMEKLSFAEEFQMLKDICLGAMSVFTILLAILATANLLPRDLEDRTIYTLLAKPVPRYAYLVGRLGGVVMLLLIFTLLMTAVSAAVLWLREMAVIGEIIQQHQVGSEEAHAAVRTVRETAFTAGLVPGVTLIFIKAAVLAAVTLLISTFSTSALFTIMIGAAVYFIGQLQGTAREFFMSSDSGTWAMRGFVAVLSLLLPDLQVFNLTDDVIAGAPIPMGIFLRTAGLGIVYVLVYTAVSAWIFSKREL